MMSSSCSAWCTRPVTLVANPKNQIVIITNGTSPWYTFLITYIMHFNILSHLITFVTVTQMMSSLGTIKAITCFMGLNVQMINKAETLKPMVNSDASE
jgi:hypothetical protein